MKNDEDIIFKMWEDVWKPSNGEREERFYNIFSNSYRYSKEKCSFNSKKNFCMKELFIVVLCLGFIAYIAFFAWCMIYKNNVLIILASNSIFLFIIVWLAGIISKWLDVKKYQETWVRHSQHCYLLEREMMLFVQGMKPYDILDQTDKKLQFMYRFIKIEDENQNKFVHNMEEKEKGLMDIFRTIKKIDAGADVEIKAQKKIK